LKYEPLSAVSQEQNTAQFTGGALTTAILQPEGGIGQHQGRRNVTGVPSLDRTYGMRTLTGPMPVCTGRAG
jgi:hypothetical protein